MPDVVAPFAQIVERVSQLPGVVHASMISGGMPLGGAMSMTDFRLKGQTLPDSTGISFRVVTPGSGSVYTVSIGGVSGSGTLRLDLVDNGTIKDAAGNPLQAGPMVAFQPQQTFSVGAGSG